jgi:hypothetical protein
MKQIVHHIRQQPHHVREMATVLCTIVVVAIIGFVWLRSFKHEIFSLLNPAEPTSQDREFAQQSKSIFASLAQLVEDSRAQISGFFVHQQTEITPLPTPSASASVHPLPVTN